MISQKDFLEFIRAVFTVLIFLGSIALTGIFSVPFLGSSGYTHHMLVEDGIFSFVMIRLGLLSVVILISFSLLYALGRLCKRKTSKVTYAVVFLCSLSISIWMILYCLNEYLWNYTPQL